jgi:hypothetical protein
VIFIDEIDFVRSLPFSTDGLFAAIEEWYNRRAGDATYEQVTFCLAGVAELSDLIRDTRRTPFNIGRRIELTDFTAAEAAPLALGLEPSVLGVGKEGSGAKARTPNTQGPTPKAQDLLKRILYWTSGHPYLTQCLCQAVAEAVAGPKPYTLNPTPLLVDRQCRRLFFSSGGFNPNLAFVRDRLLSGQGTESSPLELYGRVLRGERVAEAEDAHRGTHLRAAGIVRVVDGHLRVRNRIYERVFNLDWVEAPRL